MLMENPMENYQIILGTQGQATLVKLISIKLPACAVKPLASVKLLAYSKLPPHHCSFRARCQEPGFCLQNPMLWVLGYNWLPKYLSVVLARGNKDFKLV